VDWVILLDIHTGFDLGFIQSIRWSRT